VPYVTGSSTSSTGVTINTVNYRDVGVLLQVTPRISPDGTVVMRVIPEVSTVSPTQVNLGNGINATQFNVQHVETTVTIEDGQTVAIGGLITKRDQKTENKIPWLGDLPWVGSLFRYRTQTKNRFELMIILTPHIVRSRLDADRILAEESRRMNWIVGDMVKIHGPAGMEPMLPRTVPPGDLPGSPGYAGPLCRIPHVPGPMELLPGRVNGDVEPREALPMPQKAPDQREPLPPPRPAPQQVPDSQGSMNRTAPYAAATANAAPLPVGDSGQSWPNQLDGNGSSPNAEPGKEKRGWSLFRRQ
jgi:hypothetical protein